MSAGKKHKMVSLTDETYAMVKKKGKDWNFSAWIRARIIQMNDGIDPVQLDLDYQASTLRYKTLRAAIGEMNDEVMDDIFEKYNELMTQRTLGDFE